MTLRLSRLGIRAKRHLFHDNSAKKKAVVWGDIPEMGKGVAVGQTAETERVFTVNEVATFGDLVQDYNIIHTSMDWDEAIQSMPHLKVHEESNLVQFIGPDEKKDGTTAPEEKKRITKPLVHGMLVSSLFSSIFATLAPGCVYMNQSLNFVSPVHANDLVTGRIEITKVRRWRKGGVVVECSTQVMKGKPFNQHKETETQTPAIQGTANVWLPGGSLASTK